MKSIFITALLGTLGIGLFMDYNPYEEKESVILDGVMKYIEQIHINPKPIDDLFSIGVFGIYLDRLDGGKRFLTKNEVSQLEESKLVIDDQVLERKLDFFDQSLQLIDSAIVRSKRIFRDLKEMKLDYEKEEHIELDYDKKDFPSDIEQLKNEWRKYFKYDIVSNYYRLNKRQNNDINNWEKATENERLEKKLEEVKVLSKSELLQKAQLQSIEDIEEWFGRLDKLRRSDRFEAYLSAITNYFDPHTNYFNPKEKEDFNIRMGGKVEGIGARLSIDGDYTKVTSILPGGPAYKGKELEAEDLILEVAQEGEEAVNIIGMRLDDVVQQIRGKKGTTVTLTVKKLDGTIKVIRIERDRVNIDETFAKSVILDIPNTIDQIGYIRLPKFYSSFENKDGNSCAVDIKKEIEKLKEENVNGIILDLRNNVGGSLNDVVKIAGLFYEKGPVVKVKPHKREAYLYTDKDSSIDYDGPLIIMVNKNSASASEILAAALQDYGRAIIVGSKSTFGKGTVQRFFNLDRGISGVDDLKPLGEIKVSVQKFYRINGGSTQLKGVKSDIVLPSPYDLIESGESEYDYALEWDEIEAEEYAQNVVNLEHMDMLEKLSNERVGNNEKFQLVIENAKRLKENKDFSTYPLSIESYSKIRKSMEEENKKYNELFKHDVENFEISNLATDSTYILSTSSREDQNTEWLKSLRKDFYLYETMNIMKDMIFLEDDYALIEEKMSMNSK